MSNIINNKIQSLNDIADVQDLSNETAAEIQGGAAMTLYRNSTTDPRGRGDVLGEFNGGGLRIMSSNADDQASSVTITEGEWTFYDYQDWFNDPFDSDDTYTVGPGTYNFTGLNDDVSSFRRTG